MGNQNQNPQVQQQYFSNNKRLILNMRNRDIIIHYAYCMKLIIGDINIFPHSFDGLRLWQDNIILARYALLHNSLFQNKKVLDFKAGVGISGITIKKWTNCEKVVLCDTKDQYIVNITRNCVKNKCNNMVTFKMDISDYQMFSNSYDIFICSNIQSLCFHQKEVKQLIEMIKYLLNPLGKAILITTNKVFEQNLKKECQKNYIDFKNEKIIGDQYQISPLMNKVDGEEQFSNLNKMIYHCTTLTMPSKVNKNQQVMINREKTKQSVQLKSDQHNNKENIEKKPQENTEYQGKKDETQQNYNETQKNHKNQVQLKFQQRQIKQTKQDQFQIKNELAN